jgi:hypothetical protein
LTRYFAYDTVLLGCPKVEIGEKRDEFIGGKKEKPIDLLIKKEVRKNEKMGIRNIWAFYSFDRICFCNSQSTSTTTEKANFRQIYL